MNMGNLFETSIIRGFSGPASEAHTTPQQRYQALHYQFVASARVVRYAHGHYPQFCMGSMGCFILSYAATCDPKDVLANEVEMRRMNWYCSDVQVRGPILLTPSVSDARTISTFRSRTATSRTSRKARLTSTRSPIT